MDSGQPERVALVPDRTKLQRYADELHEGRVGEFTRIADLRARERVVILGTIHSLTLRPRAGVPALEADIEDGTGRLTCTWLGRRAIRGISAGRDIQVSGRVFKDGQQWQIFNPVYLLLPHDQ